MFFCFSLPAFFYMSYFPHSTLRNRFVLFVFFVLPVPFLVILLFVLIFRNALLFLSAPFLFLFHCYFLSFLSPKPFCTFVFFFAFFFLSFFLCLFPFLFFSPCSCHSRTGAPSIRHRRRSRWQYPSLRRVPLHRGAGCWDPTHTQQKD